MGALKRTALLVFTIASLLGVGFLALIWFAWDPIMPTAIWLSGQFWFFVVEAVLLGIFAVGMIVFFIWAITAPSTSSRLLIEHDNGAVDISRDAILSATRATIESHRGLAVKDLHMKIVGRRDPKVRIRAKVDPGRHIGLEQLGASVHDEAVAVVQGLTGHPVDQMRISFTKPEHVNSSTYVAPTPAPAPAVAAAPGVAASSATTAPLSMSPEYMANEAIAGSEGASLNVPATATR